MAGIWQINGQEPEANNLGGLALNVTTQAPDVLTLTQAAAYDANPVFAYGSTVTVTRSGAQWFKGICTGNPRRGSGSAERIEYQVSGPWWQLEQVIYQQQFLRFVEGVEATPRIAKLILGTDEAGARLHSGQVITAVVEFALAELGESAIFELGTVEPAVEMPFEELNALSCAEVISRALRWSPDVVAYFDYSASTPVLHFRRRSSLPTRTHTIATDVTISDNSINARSDLQRDGVVIQYERTDTIDGRQVKTIITDSAGMTTDPARTLYLFFDLEGSSVSYLRQPVVSKTIQITSATWWKEHDPKLQAATNISISGATKVAVDDIANGGQNDGTSYTKELVSGQIAPWMQGVGSCSQRVTADVTYTTGGGTEITERMHLDIVGTNADSQIYSTVGSSTPAEPTPSGLAAAVLSSLSQLQHEGSVTLTESEAGGETHIDHNLSIAGGRVEWASMAAQTYAVSYDLDGGRTLIQFGPAKHLGATDLYQLLRNVRTRRGSSAAIRISSSGANNDLPTRAPNTVLSSEGTGASGSYTLQVIKVSNSQVKVRAGAINSVVIAGTETAVTATDGMEVWLKLTHNATTGAVESGLITAIDPGANSETQSKVLLGEVSITEGFLSVISFHNGLLGCKSCGSVHHHY